MLRLEETIFPSKNKTDDSENTSNSVCKVRESNELKDPNRLQKSDLTQHHLVK